MTNFMFGRPLPKQAVSVLPEDVQELLSALRIVDAAREQLRAAERRLRWVFAGPSEEDFLDSFGSEAESQMRQRHRELAALHSVWSKFCEAGGVTSLDFKQWLSNGKLDRVTSKRMRTKKHLRIVSTHHTPRVRLRSDGKGDEAG